MSNHCIRFLEVLLVLTKISLSYEFPTVQVQKGDEISLAYNCIHRIDDERKDLPPVFMLHGVTDNRKTWNGIYQVIAMRTGRRVCTIDARNHGDSDWSDDFNIDIMADDVINLMKELKVEKAAFVGHSMGGLISMNIAQRQSEKVEMLVVEDIKPEVSEEISRKVLIFVKFLKQIISFVPANYTESQAQDTIEVYLKTILGENFSGDFSQFKQNYLAIHLENGVWRWKANMDVIIKAFENPESIISKEKGNVYSGKALFIYGTASDFKVFEDKENILKYFPKAEFVGIEGADHIIHPFYPQFLTEVLKFLEHSSDLQ